MYHNLVIQVLLLVFCYMTSIFLIAFAKKDNSIVDVAWGIGFILIAWFEMLTTQAFTSRSILINALITLWGLRLSGHILYRNWGKPEDKRYAAWRAEWGNSVIIRSFFQVFMLQGLVMLIISSPTFFVHTQHNPALNWLDYVGMVIWCIGFIFEAIGDYQLLVFNMHPSNKSTIMKQGLWRYTRHPNYFGEVTLWWGIFLIALSVPYGWLSIISPLTITYLILYISGIPMTEKFFESNPDFIEYKKETSAFFPWFYKTYYNK